jgi:hypothetical protein
MSKGLGLKAKHERTCQRCGTVFTATKATARYCGAACWKAAGRYGRSHGTVVPRRLGWTKT